MRTHTRDTRIRGKRTLSELAGRPSQLSLAQLDGSACEKRGQANRGTGGAGATNRDTSATNGMTDARLGAREADTQGVTARLPGV